MDPVSITAAVLTIATRCLSLAKYVHDTTHNYNQVPDTLSHLVDTVTITRAALAAVNNHLESRSILSLSTDLEDVFPRATSGIEATLLCLESEFCNLCGRDGWWVRVQALWKEDTMEGMLRKLERGQNNLQLLISTLQLYVRSSLYAHS